MKDEAILLLVFVDKEHFFFCVVGSRSVPLEACVTMLALRLLQFFGHRGPPYAESIDACDACGQAIFFWRKFTFWSCTNRTSETDRQN